MQFLYRKNNSAISIMALLFISASAAAQSGKKKVSAFPFPIIYYTPETKLAYGIAGTVTFRYGNDSLNKKPSTILAGIAGTQNKQLLIYTQYQLFFNRFYLFGEAGYYKYNYFFYGTGNNTVPEELYAVNYPRIKINAAYKWLPNFYAGLGYQFENYNIKNITINGELSKGIVPGSTGSVVSGLGLQTVYDTRDTVLFPTKGWFANASFMVNGKYIGGNYKFNRFVLDVSAYQKLSLKLVLAVNSYNSFITGNAPFQQLSQVGGNKLLRGYYQGRYMDKNLVALQTELRFPIYKRFGAAIFGSSGALGGDDSFLNFSQMRYSYGGGIRFTMNRKEHLNLRLDYAIGKGTSGFYLTFGEAF